MNLIRIKSFTLCIYIFKMPKLRMFQKFYLFRHACLNFSFKTNKTFFFQFNVLLCARFLYSLSFVCLYQEIFSVCVCGCSEAYLENYFSCSFYISFFIIVVVFVFKRLDLMLFLTQKAELFKSKFWQMKHPNICSNLILPY